MFRMVSFACLIPWISPQKVMVGHDAQREILISSTGAIRRYLHKISDRQHAAVDVETPQAQSLKLPRQRLKIQQLFEPLRVDVLLNITAADSKAFNAAFVAGDTSRGISGIGVASTGAGVVGGLDEQVRGFILARYLQAPWHYKQCSVPPPFLIPNTNFAFAVYNPSSSMLESAPVLSRRQRGSANQRNFHRPGLQFTPMKIPDNVVCNEVAEPKWFMLQGEAYVYASTWGNCPNSMLEGIPPAAMKTFTENTCTNYIFKVGSEHALPLVYDDRIEPDNPTAKNFLFFDFGNSTFALTLISPHKVYQVNLSTGRMISAFQTSHSLPTKYDIGLSAGPVRIQNNSFLVVGHIRQGGWGGLRLPFFYVFDAEPPFPISAVSPPFTFGMSDHHLEYVTGISLDRQDMIISLGINDCNSSLIRIPIKSVLQRLSPASGSIFERAFHLMTGEVLHRWQQFQ
mmetsp:Transcript_93782/g.165351  ORF Transcript_93782/g.165351 Transcript_93782/m.165351 type:complete len:456 (-) Transcript_93782:86-1453(-)